MQRNLWLGCNANSNEQRIYYTTESTFAEKGNRNHIIHGKNINSEEMSVHSCYRRPFVILLCCNGFVVHFKWNKKTMVCSNRCTKNPKFIHVIIEIEPVVYSIEPFFISGLSIIAGQL